MKESAFVMLILPEAGETSSSSRGDSSLHSE